MEFNVSILFSRLLWQEITHQSLVRHSPRNVRYGQKDSGDHQRISSRRRMPYSVHRYLHFNKFTPIPLVLGKRPIRGSTIYNYICISKYINMLTGIPSCPVSILTFLCIDGMLHPSPPKYAQLQCHFLRSWDDTTGYSGRHGSM